MAREQKGVYSMRKQWILGISLIGLLTFWLFFLILHRIPDHQQKIFINEVCSLNGSIIRDGVYDCSDYIELYNASEETVDVGSWYLSDDETAPKKYKLPHCEIEPGGYAVFYANDQEGERSLPFKLSNAGEKIFLSDIKGNLADSVAVPELQLNQTYSRVTDGASSWAVKKATFLAPNEAGALIPDTVLENPQFSAVSSRTVRPVWVS